MLHGLQLNGCSFHNTCADWYKQTDKQTETHKLQLIDSIANRTVK